MKEVSGRPASILTLQILLFLDFYYAWVYLVLGLIIYIYKAATLFYPPNTLAPEVVGLLLMAILQFSRISLGNSYKGSSANRTESLSSSLWLVALCICSIIVAVFYLIFQTFV
jgi:hypothetical protein